MGTNFKVGDRVLLTVSLPANPEKDRPALPVGSLGTVVAAARGELGVAWDCDDSGWISVRVEVNGDYVETVSLCQPVECQPVEAIAQPHVSLLSRYEVKRKLLNSARWSRSVTARRNRTLTCFELSRAGYMALFFGDGHDDDQPGDDDQPMPSPFPPGIIVAELAY